MPCYLFTYHAYRSWMPDRAQGYVRRHKGILPQDFAMATQYDQSAKFDQMRFLHEHQRWMIDVLLEAMQRLDSRLHYVATDLSHLHVLTSWNGDVSWEHLRNSLKKALTISLKTKYEDRP